MEPQKAVTHIRLEPANDQQRTVQATESHRNHVHMHARALLDLMCQPEAYRTITVDKKEDVPAAYVIINNSNHQEIIDAVNFLNTVCKALANPLSLNDNKGPKNWSLSNTDNGAVEFVALFSNSESTEEACRYMQSIKHRVEAKLRAQIFPEASEYLQ